MTVVLIVSTVTFFGVLIVTVVMGYMRYAGFWIGLMILLGILIFTFVTTLIDVIVNMFKAKRQLNRARQANDAEQIEMSEYRLELALLDWNSPFVAVLSVIICSLFVPMFAGVFLLDAIPSR